MIIDCDKNVVENPFNDISEMPNEMITFLRKQLTNPSADLRGNRIPKIFLSSLVQIIGGYRDAIKYTDSKLKFDNDVFIESQPLSNRAFVQKIVQSQIFQQLIEERLKLIQNGAEMSDEFEMEVELHAERMGRKFKFIKNFRSRANPAMKNAVKSVRAMGKELKLKIKDSNSQKVEKFDYMSTISIPKTDKTSTEHFPSFPQFYPTVSNNLIESPSTSSSQSSSSEMNILQELEAMPMFKPTSQAIPSQKPREECNLIDLSDSVSSIQFDPLENPTTLSKSRRDPFGSSELLKDVVDELNRSSTSVASKRSNWTKFE